MIIYKIIKKTVPIVLLIFIVYLSKPAVRYIDFNYFNENIRDFIGYVISSEDWEKAVPLPKNLNEEWLLAATTHERPFYLIAHALGAVRGQDNNTYVAFEQSRLRGFKLFEVDLSLDEMGRLRCHHGPEPAPDFDPQLSCIFDHLLLLVDEADGWLILDIKTNFYLTASKILQQATDMHLLHRLVFQLYRSDELAWFSMVSTTVRLPLPIITVYNSRRSANHILSNANRLGIKVLTVPTEKLGSLVSINENVVFLTHPVHNCEDWKKIRPDMRIGGIYTAYASEILKCGVRVGN